MSTSWMCLDINHMVDRYLPQHPDATEAEQSGVAMTNVYDYCRSYYKSRIGFLYKDSSNHRSLLLRVLYLNEYGSLR